MGAGFAPRLLHHIVSCKSSAVHWLFAVLEVRRALVCGVTGPECQGCGVAHDPPLSDLVLWKKTAGRRPSLGAAKYSVL